LIVASEQVVESKLGVGECRRYIDARLSKPLRADRDEQSLGRLAPVGQVAQTRLDKLRSGQLHPREGTAILRSLDIARTVSSPAAGTTGGVISSRRRSPMTNRRMIVLAIAAAAFAALVAGAAAAPGHAEGRLFRFSGELLANPGSHATTLSLQVETGNEPALRALLGASQNETFALGSSSEVLVWSHGVPHVGSTADLQQGDYVTLNVRAPRGSTLQAIEQIAAAVVAEHAAPHGGLPVWMFAGTVAGGRSGGKIALHVESGNWKALQAMLGQPLDQTFRYDDGTIFLLWQGRVPSVIDPSQLESGDRITVRIRAPRSASLSQVEATPAARVGDHEPPVAPEE
jgi:hypothetical protein